MVSNLAILAEGFAEYEKRIIETTIRLSKNRTPSLSAADNISEADVILIDGKNPSALNWVKLHASELQKKTIMWVDIEPQFQNNLQFQENSPIMWVNLPVILSKALDEIDLRESQQINAERTDNSLEERMLSESSVNRGEVLVVDDSKAVRDHLVRALTKRNILVTAVEDGEQAVNATKEKPFDCVLMDVLMPGIDGYKACREIRRQKHHSKIVPVVMLTSRTSPFDKVRGKMAGCDAYITKPVKLSKLIDVVESYLV